VADTRCANGITDDAITNDIWGSDDKLAHVGSRHRPATVGKSHETIASIHETGRECPWVELLDICPDEPKMSRRRC
jgi:hypothetical protein